MNTEPSSELFKKIHKVLAQNYNKTYTLEELTNIITMPYTNPYIYKDNKMENQRENQAKVLDILILLETEGLITLNSSTDESSVKLKGIFTYFLRYY